MVSKAFWELVFMKLEKNSLPIWRVAVITGLLLTLLTVSAEAFSSEAENPQERVPPRRPALSGDIILEGPEKKASIYEITQDNALSYMQHLSHQVQAASSGASISPIPPLAPDVQDYLTGVYLYCSVQRGTCPFVLQAILEIDIINSRLSGQNSCPNMQAFWKRWLENDMENRHRHSVRTGHMHATHDFNQSVRPRFVRCQETVAKEIAAGSSNPAEFFRSRYRDNSQHRRDVATSLALLEQIKANIPNIFRATGS